MRKVMWLAAVGCAVACNKKSENQAPKVVAKEPAPAPAPATPKVVPLTTKSADARAAFERARDMFDIARAMEARDDLQKAIAADPDFAMAHAYLGNITPGAEGMAELDKAATLAAKLPEAEKLVIDGAVAMRGGERDKAIAAWKRAAELAPDDWRPHTWLAENLLGANDFDAAIAESDAALKIKPDLPGAYNVQAYAHAAKREWEPAIAAAKKQTELAPKEPNPQDTLGEILMRAGKMDDAETGFQSAIALDPKFVMSWQGIAFARGFRGDWKRALEAAEKYRDSSTEPNDKIAATIDLAWLTFASGKQPEAIALLDGVMKQPGADKLPATAFAAFDHEEMLQLTGKYPEAAKEAAAARARAATLPGQPKQELERRYAIDMLRIAAMTGKPSPDADKLLATFADTSTPALQSRAQWAHGLSTWAKAGAKSAIGELSNCTMETFPCVMDLAAAERKAGDTAGAEKTEQALRELYVRDGADVYVHTKLPKK